MLALRTTVGTLALGLALTAVPERGLAAGVPVDQASKDLWSAAQKTFLAADELYDAKRYAESITAYRASWNIVASPNTRLQIARALRELQRLPEAYEELFGVVSDAEQAAKKDEKYARTAKAAREELALLRSKIALVQIQIEPEVPEGASLSVGGRSIGLDAAQGPVAAAAGEVTAVLTIPGRAAVQRSVSVAPGGDGTVAFDLSEPVAAPPATTPVGPAPTREPVATAPAPSSLRPYAYIAGGIGVAGLATFAAFGIMNNSKFSDLDDSCSGGRCPGDRDDDIATGRRYQTIANIGLVVGAVGLGTGVTLFFLEPKSSEASAAVGLGAGPGTLHLRGRF